MSAGRCRTAAWLATVLTAGGLIAAAGTGSTASAATPPALHLKILLIGEGSSDVTTTAWRSALDHEGVPYTLVTATGTAPDKTVSLPQLSSSGTGNYNGVVIADSPYDYTTGALTALDSYERAFGVRQVDGYMYPSPTLGVTEASGGALDGTTATLTDVGRAALGALKGLVPFDVGTYGYAATVDPGAPYTSFITDSAGNTMAGVYQHPTDASPADPQAGVSELSITFDYNENQLQWLLLAPWLTDWVTQDTHLGLYRSYFGQDIDDTFIADNEWSSQFQCTPAATNPPDYTCPPADQGVLPGSAPGVPADVQMSAADVSNVADWEQRTGIKLELAFNGIGACTADTAAHESNAKCSSSFTDGTTKYTDPGQVVDPSYPDDAGLVNALLADQADFGWINHTWSHLFLGCTNWQPQDLTAVTATASGGTLAAGSYSYEVAAATAYGESEPSSPRSVSVGSGGSVTLTWPEASNGTGTSGAPGPTLAQEEASHSGGTGFWGYDVYRQNPGSATYGLVGQVAENLSATSATTYSFADVGTAAGSEPNSGPGFPTATNPGIDCSGSAGSWLSASSTQADASIDAEIGLNQAFGAANRLTSYTPAAVVTGEHSGIENPNMSGALADTKITTIAADASRQSEQYLIGKAPTAPRYPSNIYYNASNWPDELNEYNTLYVANGDPLGDPAHPGETGHCVDTSSTTCLSTPATEASLLASETRIMLSHVLSNDPRVGYAHQSDLIGPATQNGQDYGYTILGLIDQMRSKYDSWYATSAPLEQMTDVTEAKVLAEQGGWAAAGGHVSATVQNGVVTITNSGSSVSVPVTVPPGTTVGGSGFGQPYGGDLSAWTTLAKGATLTLSENTGPAITSATSSTSIVGAPFTFTVTTTGAPVPSLAESGSLPAGLSFTDNGDGTATISGTPAVGSGGSYPVTISATSSVGSDTQPFTLVNDEAPTITSPSAASFAISVAGSYHVTTTGYPAPAIAESGALPSGLSFTDNGDGTAAISGTPASGSAGSYPVTISASNASGSTATLALTITVSAAAGPAITSGSIADFTLNQAGAVAVTATGSPVPSITETGALPAGLSFTDNENGTALLSGTPTATGTTSLTIRASNGVGSAATQAMSVVVGQAPAFTSASSATASPGSPFTFTITASGYPAPSFGWSNVPPGLTFTDNGDGTATLSGTPTTPGSYAMDLSAVSGYGTAQQTLTVTVQQAPAITSASSATFTTGTNGSFSLTTTGSPVAAISESGSLPSGVTLTDNGDGTATLAGTPAAGTTGSYALTITASNGVSPDATQHFTLTVNTARTAPTITSAGSVTFAVGSQGSFSVTTTGGPVAAISESGSLPSGVALTDNGNGTATLAGTPAAGSGGSYDLTITASNGVSPDATQHLTLTVGPALAAPMITSAGATTFAAGQAGSFTVTTAGNPAAALSATSSPALPAGVRFTDNGDGTATLTGQAPAGSQGTYALTITASNSAGTASQSFTLTVNSGLAITSAGAATATSGQPFSFTVTTTGSPTPTLSEAGTLPAGLTFTANANGTATLSGTPATTAHGIYLLTFGAKNSTGPTSQAFALTVDEAPAFTSSASVTETAGTAFTYLVSTRSYPTATLSAATLPTGVTFSDNGNGTGTLSGPATVAAGTSSIVIAASNSGGTTRQTISLAVRVAGTSGTVPAFTSASAASATAGSSFSFTVTTAGTFVTGVTRSGALPAGVSFLSLDAGTAILSGIPTAASGGVYPITFTAKNSAGTTTQVFVLTVTAAPAITTTASSTATVGSAYSFTVSAVGWPRPALTESGVLPQGLTWVDDGNGKATLTGTPGVGQGGSYRLTFTAASPLGTATQAFTLTVDQAPAITSAAAAAATRGTPFTFTFTSTGYPRPSLAHSGTVPGLSFTSNSNGTITLSGTPTTSGTYPLTITAKNPVGSVTQAFTLTVS